MGSYVAVRGWIECEFEQVELLVRALGAFDVTSVSALVGSEQYALYMKGWRFPSEPVGWTAYCFYGCDIRGAALPVLQAQVEMLSGVNKEWVGYFRVDSDDGEITEEWEVVDGGMIKRERLRPAGPTGSK